MPPSRLGGVAQWPQGLGMGKAPRNFRRSGLLAMHPAYEANKFRVSCSALFVPFLCRVFFRLPVQRKALQRRGLGQHAERQGTSFCRTCRKTPADEQCLRMLGEETLSLTLSPRSRMDIRCAQRQGWARLPLALALGPSHFVLPCFQLTSFLVSLLTPVPSYLQPLRPG